MKRSPEPRSVKDSESIFTHVVRAEDINMHGTLFGGKMMAFMDTTAAIAAMRHAGRNCVTERVSDISFLAPVRTGHILEIVARIDFTARSSMEVGVQAFREDHMTGDKRMVCEAHFIFVAIDSEGSPVPTPGLTIETDEERERFEAGQRRYETHRTTRNQG
ncbi:MAG: acyl-CoA thioesterase [Planctomycetes bacterium]|nr:acyl-CoA thioesterase [Planctomycetota bacterium]